jgi:hypothetical protein
VTAKVSRDTGEIYAPRPQISALPPKGKVAVYVCTSAQNNTKVHPKVWESLMRVVEDRKAILLVGAITYNKANQYDEKKTKTSKERDSGEDEWWDVRVEPHLFNSGVQLAPGLIWCGELNILPTAVNPISGFESYTGRFSSILPHTKFAMTSVPSPKFSGTKFVYTTGTVTLRNYIQKKAGQKAEFHHGYGALIVEVDSDGNWFVRQLNADSDGTIYDLDRRYTPSGVTGGHRVEGVVWGDLHERQLEPAVRDLAWGREGILDQLKPKYQIFHDLLDFRSQNHHDRDDPWKTYDKFLKQGLDVRSEIEHAKQFLGFAKRPWCQSLVVCSNHDMALVRWLKECDFREDPRNAEFMLEANLAAYKAMRRGDKDWYAVEWAFRHGDMFGPEIARFLRRDERFLLCPESGGGIDVSMHGDKGANGAKGSLRGFAMTGRKCIVGDRHSAGIFEGAMQVGVMGSLDMGYNEGMSSWSHTNAIVYPNGKRTLFTIWNGKWRG